MKGWFDAFRCGGGPTLYNFHNRTAVTGDVTTITFLAIFTTLYLAFLIIFLGIRKEKCSTFCAVTLSLFIGATILITVYGSAWQVSKTPAVITYRAYSKEKVIADIGVYIGLKHVNITLQASNNNWTTDVDFNERFMWLDSYQMSNSFKEALIRGLPFPILTIAEYFTVGQEGLAWGGQYRAAGYFAIVMLWTSFAIWMLMNLMLIVVPRYGALLMTLCGFLLLSTVCGYFGMLPETPLVIHVEGAVLNFELGWCYWLVLIAGGICLLAGVIITAVEIINPHSFMTILEVDYDTPYDRHIIIEDSREKRFQKKNIESKQNEPIDLSTKILRRLNSKSKLDLNENKTTEIRRERQFYLQPSTWKYPYKGNEKGQVVTATPSESSRSSLSEYLSPIHKDRIRQEHHRPDRIQSVSMW